MQLTQPSTDLENLSKLTYNNTFTELDLERVLLGHVVLELNTQLFHSGCVLFVNVEHAGLEQQHRITHSNRLLAKHGVHSITRSLQQFNATLKHGFHCKQNRPLYVLFSDQHTRQLLQQVQQVWK